MMTAFLRPCVWLLLPLAFGCSHSEPSHQPLGMGPLALAEQAERRAQKAPAHERRREEPKEEPSSAPTETTPKSAPPTPQVATAESSTVPSDAGTESGDAGVPPSPEAWLGTYVGNDVTRYVMEDQPERRYDDPKARIRVEKSQDSRLRFVFVDSSSGQELCTIEGDMNGFEAKLPAGQRCFVDPDEDMRVRSRPGSAKLSGTRLTLSLVLDTILDMEELHTEGRIEYEFDGNKQ